MVIALNYWQMAVLNPSGTGLGYRLCPQLLAKSWIESVITKEKVQDWADRQIQQNILKQFFQERAKTSNWFYSSVGLSLRCYVSHRIVQACYRRAERFGQNAGIKSSDLLPFALDDDGGMTPKPYLPLSYKILESFDLGRGSLDAWVDRLVRQHAPLNDFLVENGQYITSGWAVLKRAKSHFLANETEQLILKAFHQVYRRDRLQQLQSGVCPKLQPPTTGQLQEMLTLLEEWGLNIHSPNQLMRALEKMVGYLREREIWGKRRSPLAESLDSSKFLNEQGEERYHSKDLPRFTVEMEQPDEQHQRLAMEQLCSETLVDCLDQSIRQGIDQQLHCLQKSARRRHLVNKLKPALYLFYNQNKTQTQIAKVLNMKNQSEVSRMLAPKKLLNHVQQQTIDSFLKALLHRSEELGIAAKTTPQHLDSLLHHVEEFTNDEVFDLAIAELTASKSTAKDSLYATRMRTILKQEGLEDYYGS